LGHGFSDNVDGLSLQNRQMTYDLGHSDPSAAASKAVAGSTRLSGIGTRDLHQWHGHASVMLVLLKIQLLK
jgi:hypothetical protein